MKYLFDSIAKGENYSQKQEQVEVHIFPEFSPNLTISKPASTVPGFQHLLSCDSLSQRTNHADETLLDEESEKRAEALKEEILTKARRRAESIEREAYEKGYHQGEVTGEKVAQKKFESTMASLQKTLLEMDKLKAEIVVSMEPFLVQLALKIARKIVHHEITLNPDVILQTIRAAMNELVHTNTVTVRLNPSDYQHVSQYPLHIAEGVKNLIFEADPGIDRGGAILETDFGDLDARIEQQFSRIEHNIQAVLQEHQTMEKRNG
jgi:flagellar biosynthesis/type III secretory pathway protein FliH